MRTVNFDPLTHKVVPIVATNEMANAGMLIPLKKAARHHATYRAMIDAAPDFPAQPVSGEPVVEGRGCNYPLCQSEADQERIADEVHAMLYSGKAARR